MPPEELLLPNANGGGGQPVPLQTDATRNERPVEDVTVQSERKQTRNSCRFTITEVDPSGNVIAETEPVEEDYRASRLIPRCPSLFQSRGQNHEDAKRERLQRRALWDQHGVPMHFFTLQFEDLDLETRYIEDYLRRSKRFVTVGLLATICFVSFMGVWGLIFSNDGAKVKPQPVIVMGTANTPEDWGFLQLAVIIELVVTYNLEVLTRKDFILASMVGGSVSEENRRSEALLLSIMPRHVISRIKKGGAANGNPAALAIHRRQSDAHAGAGPRPSNAGLLKRQGTAPLNEQCLSLMPTVADAFDEATILFADICGFTVLSSRVSAQVLVSLLNQLFTQFDRIAAQCGLEKIKTIGDAYMVAGGVPLPTPDHAKAVCRMGLKMVAAVENFEDDRGDPIRTRVGIHSGPCVAGVIGIHKFAYDLWGDAVNTASRMESHGEPMRVHCSDATHALIEGDFECESRGQINVKGKGPMDTFFVVREKPESARMPLWAHRTALSVAVSAGGGQIVSDGMGGASGPDGQVCVRTVSGRKSIDISQLLLTRSAELQSCHESKWRETPSRLGLESSDEESDEEEDEEEDDESDEEQEGGDLENQLLPSGRRETLGMALSRAASMIHSHQPGMHWYSGGGTGTRMSFLSATSGPPLDSVQGKEGGGGEEINTLAQRSPPLQPAVHHPGLNGQPAPVNKSLD
uniref:Guanylate cyclase domain-containing protein n=1 Tax=Chromera velia CCMP2878 TaxID=1169474 RepID=A0A0G4F7L9_9ALVE|eukprot:Cvel_15632.t1-p1 / transcript=Cvel_15632.t1 / gene=Cvel_15632 / organism=Chromera_velia_CCMP2878 / gene_product=Adenylate cyclase, putative / transcript_product=Adenylate cyclase, putative / location=Cvel_scaffold1165:3642-11787(-) / protein_length=690 / sequence_SO=supercontig / SO=protein_coding / is_pseudo=false